MIRLHSANNGNNPVLSCPILAGFAHKAIETGKTPTESDVAPCALLRIQMWDGQVIRYSRFTSRVIFVLPPVEIRRM